MICQIPDCLTDTGSAIVCDFHRKHMNPNQRKDMKELWHALIRDKGRIGFTGQVLCFHCEQPFPEDKTCGDHFPWTKGRRKDLEFDVDNGVPCCKTCNTSNAKTRKDPYEFIRH